jgi:hypothetical protein
MKSLRLQVFAFGWMLVALCSTAWASFPALSYDTVTADTISTAAQTNTYTFSANANDILDFTVVTTSGSFHPCLQVSTYPAGTPVTNGGSCPGGTDVELNGLAIPSAGTYSLSVKDYYNSYTGGYNVFLQRTDGPVGALPLPFEQVQTGNIGSATQSNAYTFSANANDVFNFTVVTTSSSLHPCMQVYNSAGAKVPNGNSCPGGTDVELNGVAVPSAGTYSVIVKDYYDAYTGNYNIFLQRVDGPPNPITLSYDTVTAGTISAAAQTNNYTFAANANDILDFTVVTTSASLHPCIQVSTYPAGTPVAKGGSCPGGTDVELNGLAIPSAGTYTLSVKDYYDAYTGNYNVFLQRTDGPYGAVMLPIGAVQTGTIGSATQSNAYTFNANADDVFNFTVVTTSSSLHPCMQVYNAAGTPVAKGGACPGGTDVELNGFAVPSAGTYSVIVKDYYDAYTGDYNIFLQRTNDPANPIDVLFDQTMTGAISAVAQSNAYTFNGTANDILNFTVVTTNGSLHPCMQIYNSAGATVPNGSSCPGGGQATLSGFTVPSTGIYFVILKDYYDAYVGNYNISVQCSGTCLLPVPTLASISPPSALAGSGGFTLTVNGANFANVESNSVVQWNGNPLATTYVSSSQMTAAVPATDVATAGTPSVTVFTPTPGGGTSNSLPFTVNNPVPALTSISPTNTSAGGPAFTLTVNGSNFVQGSWVQWNTFSLFTTYVSATQLTALVPAGDISSSGPATITVFNPTPGGGTSNGITFTVNPPSGTPVITWPALAPITYGTALSATQLDATAALNGTTVPGAFAYSYVCPSKSGVAMNGTVLPAGACTLSVTFTPTNHAYTTPSPSTNPLTVSQATPSIAWAKPAAITTITPLSASQLDATETWTVGGKKVAVAGSSAYSYNCIPWPQGPATIGTLLPTGACVLSVLFGPTDAVDYTNATDSVPITVVLPTAVEPVFSPAAATYPAAQLVSLADITPGATIYYTTNGSAPSPGAATTYEYTVPFLVSTNDTVKAIAEAPSYLISATASAAYKFIGSPSVLAEPATAITTSTATLNALVNTNGLAGYYYFQYWTSNTTQTPETTQTNLPASAAAVTLSAPITGLVSGTTYYYQVVVVTDGGLATGAVLNFTAN